MEELPAMTGAELQATREFLGLSRGWLANKLQINERRIMRMDADQEPIPMAVVSLLDEVAVDTKTLVNDLTAKYRRLVKSSGDTAGVFLRTYRTDEIYAAHDPDSVYPSRWHRMVAARVCEAVPGLIMSYWDKDEQPELFDIRKKADA